MSLRTQSKGKPKTKTRRPIQGPLVETLVNWNQNDNSWRLRALRSRCCCLASHCCCLATNGAAAQQIDQPNNPQTRLELREFSSETSTANTMDLAEQQQQTNRRPQISVTPETVAKADEPDGPDGLTGSRPGLNNGQQQSVAEASQSAKRQHQSNVDDVQGSFIMLLGYNKMMDILIPTVAYALLMSSLLLFLNVGSERDPKSLVFRLYGMIRWDQYDSLYQLAYNYWLMISALLFAALITIVMFLGLALTIFVVITTLHFGSAEIQTRSRQRQQILHCIHSVALRVTVVILFLPTTSFLLINNIGYKEDAAAVLWEQSKQASATTSSWWDMDAETLVHYSCLLNIRLPLASLLVGIYMQPLLFEGNPNQRNNRIMYFLTILPHEVLSFLSLATQDELEDGTYFVHLLYLILMPTVLALGYFKKRLFVSSVYDRTFSGANQLIEAKVSLEQQRQQQETLLLSVLPAYVADQVKRNMLRLAGPNSSPNNNSSSLPADQLAPAQDAANYNLTSGFSLPQAPNVLAKSSTINIAQPTQNSSSDLNANNEQQQNRHSSFLIPGKLASTIQGALHHHANYSNNNQQSSANNSNLTLNTSNSVHNRLHVHNPANNNRQLLNLPHQIHGPLSPSSSASSRRGFNELYIRTYNNVSLLYGDIVGFTALCTQLSSSQLVRVLNDLFSHFDYLAEKHKIMRIKILGDCYYGVSGIPEFAVMGSKLKKNKTTCNSELVGSKSASSSSYKPFVRCDNHAINCVNMGLDMIHYIRCLNIERASLGKASPTGVSDDKQAQAGNQRACLNMSLSAGQSATTRSNLDIRSPSALGTQGETGNQLCMSTGNLTPLPVFELNMRIGIHTGHIHSGVIGLKKWQFDVWSNDVSIAMHCESSGVAGRVQVTEATVQQLNGAFTFEEALGCQRDQFLAQNEIKTFLIKDRKPSLQLTGVQAANVSNKKNEETGARLAFGSGNLPGDSLDISGGRKSATFSVDSSSRIQQQRFESMGLECLKESNSNLEEDNIRAATIGTIRQTLLAGEKLSNGLASYLMLHNHPDIYGFSLNFKDKLIGKLYANGHIDNFLIELGSMFLIIVVLMTLINYLLVDAKSAPTLMLVPLINTALLLACLLVGSTNVDKSSSASSSVMLNFSQSSFDEELTRCPQNQENLMNVSLSDQNQVISSIFSSNNDTPSKQKVGWFRLKLNKLKGQLRGRARFLERRNNSKSLMKTLSIVSVYSIVIVSQLYLITSQAFSCRNDDLLYKLTVLFVLISLDLNSQLINHFVKFSIIMIILFVQILMSFNSVPDLVRLTKLDFLFEFESSQCKYSYYNDMPISPGQKLTKMSEALLLLMLTFWSLTFARQLEFTNKTNFLWRNRLNVDHEELEYISGINKVLLENILPSHVVQYYMSHPNEPVQQSQRPNQPNQSAAFKNYMRMSKFEKTRNILLA